MTPHRELVSVACTHLLRQSRAICLSDAGCHASLTAIASALPVAGTPRHMHTSPPGARPYARERTDAPPSPSRIGTRSNFNKDTGGRYKNNTRDVNGVKSSNIGTGSTRTGGGRYQQKEAGHSRSMPRRADRELPTVETFTAMLTRTWNSMGTMNRHSAQEATDRILTDAKILMEQMDRQAASVTQETLVGVLERSLSALQALAGIVGDTLAHRHDRRQETRHGLPLLSRHQMQIEPILKWLMAHAGDNKERMLRVHILRWHAYHDALVAKTAADSPTTVADTATARTNTRYTDKDAVKSIPALQHKDVESYLTKMVRNPDPDALFGRLVLEMTKCLILASDPQTTASEPLVFVSKAIDHLVKGHPEYVPDDGGTSFGEIMPLPEDLVEAVVLAMRDQAQIAVTHSQRQDASGSLLPSDWPVDLSKPEVRQCLKFMVRVYMQLERLSGPIGLHSVANELIPYASLVLKPAQIVRMYRAQRQIAQFGRPVGYWSRNIKGGEAVGVAAGCSFLSDDKDGKRAAHKNALARIQAGEPFQEAEVGVSARVLDVVLECAAKMDDIGMCKIVMRSLRRQSATPSHVALGELIESYWRNRTNPAVRFTASHVLDLYATYASQTPAGKVGRVLNLIMEILSQHPGLQLSDMHRLEVLLERHQEHHHQEEHQDYQKQEEHQDHQKQEEHQDYQKQEHQGQGLRLPARVYAPLIVAYTRMRDIAMVEKLYGMAQKESHVRGQRLDAQVAIAAATANVRQGRAERATEILDAWVADHGQEEDAAAKELRLEIADVKEGCVSGGRFISSGGRSTAASGGPAARRARSAPVRLGGA